MPIEIKLEPQFIWKSLRSLGTPLKWLWRLLRAMPDRTIPWFYSRKKCGDAVTIIGSGGPTGGPTIYVNRDRTHFSIEEITLAVINGLPFPITVVNLNLTISLNSVTFCKFAKTETEIIVNNTVQQLTPINIDRLGLLTVSHILDTQQANTARGNSSDCAHLVISGIVTFKTLASEFRKSFGSIVTLVFVSGK